MRMLRCTLLLLLLLSVPAAWATPVLPDAQALFDQYREASGGAAWDAVGVIRSHGSMAVAGLSGSLQTLEEPASGRSRSSYDLGVVRGAQGFDGQRNWTLDPGGELRIVDALEARQAAATSAWLVRRGYWNPQRQPAIYGQVSLQEVDGHGFHVLQATPQGGVPISLWFDRDNHLLVRSVTSSGAQASTTTLSDWRRVGDLLLPFASVQDDGAAGNQIRIQFERIELQARPDDPAFAVPAGQAQARIDNPDGQTRIDFALRNNHIYADAQIDGQPVRMLVDTGGVNLLSTTAAARLGLKTEGKLAGRGVGEQTADVSFAKAGELRFGDVVLTAPTLYVFDLGILADIEGEPLDGVIGYELFHHFGVQIDYAGEQLTLTDAAHFTPAQGSSAVPFELAERIPIIAGDLDGLPVRLTVDTGSRASLTVHSPFAREHQLARKYQATPESITGWGVGGPAKGQLVRLGVLRIGDQSIRHLAADLHTGTKGALTDAQTSANLGGGVLKRFTVGFDYAKRTLYLKPNALFASEDTPDRSGLWLRQDGSLLRVLEVAPGSAAAAAGFQREQQIDRIDGEAVDSQHLAYWREQLRRPAGTVIEVRVVGEKTPRAITLQDRLQARSVVLGAAQ